MNTQLFTGRFEVQGEIAKGKTGTIYYGYDLDLRQEMAIKTYHSHINGRIIRGKAFIEKSKPLLRLEHPNLIKIMKVEEVDGTPVVCMEFFDAPSLQQVINEKGPLPVEKMLLLAREIAEVLVHIHFQGIIHGTLHPGHVLVGPQGQIKVMDLGLSWILMDILSNCDADLLRPLPYLPPEIAKGELLNVSSDLYCLGFMMYHMLTKHVPYSGLPKTSIMGKLAYDQADPDFDFPNSVPEAICELIRQMTRNKSQHRLQDATHVLTILNQQLAKLTPEVSKTPSTSLEPRQEKESSKPPLESPASPPQAQALDPTAQQGSPSIQLKNSSIYQVKAQASFRKKLRVSLGIILLLIGTAIGYWYKEWIQIPIFSSIHESTHPTQPLTKEIETVLPMDSSGTTQPQTQISPQPSIFKNEEKQGTDDLHHTERSTPILQENFRMEDSGSGVTELKGTVSPSLSSQDNTGQTPPISLEKPGSTINLNPESSQMSRPKGEFDKTTQPLAKGEVTSIAPTPPTQKPSPTTVETGQEVLPIVKKNSPSRSELPAEPITGTPEGPQESPPASFTKGSLEHAESKELNELLDSVAAPETVTSPPSNLPIPSAAPSSSSGLTSPESSP